MKNYFFIKTDVNTNKAWGDVCEGFTSYCSNSQLSLEDKFNGRTDHEQQIFSYVKIDRKLGLYKTEDNKLALSVATPTPNVTIGVKNIDFDLIKSKLDSGVKVVYFAYIFKNEATSQVQVVQNSTYFGRNPLDNVMTDFVTGKQIEGHISAAVWMAFYKIKNTNFYISVLNDVLVDSTIIRETVSDADICYDDHVIELLNTHDGSIKESLFKPTVTGGTFFGKNIIIATGNSVTVDVMGDSIIHIFNRVNKINELPEIDLTVECSDDIEVDNTKLNIKLDNPITTLKYRWNTGSELDFVSSYDNKLQYEFVILKM